MLYLIFYVFGFFKMSSLYLYVCGDDHVTCYMGADDNIGEQADT